MAQVCLSVMLPPPLAELVLERHFSNSACQFWHVIMESAHALFHANAHYVLNSHHLIHSHQTNNTHTHTHSHSHSHSHSHTHTHAHTDTASTNVVVDEVYLQLSSKKKLQDDGEGGDGGDKTIQALRAALAKRALKIHTVRSPHTFFLDLTTIFFLPVCVLHGSCEDALTA